MGMNLCDLSSSIGKMAAYEPEGCMFDTKVYLVEARTVILYIFMKLWCSQYHYNFKYLCGLKRYVFIFVVCGQYIIKHYRQKFSTE